MLLCTALTPDGIMYFSAVTPDGIMYFSVMTIIITYCAVSPDWSTQPNTKQTITVTPDGTRASEHLMVLCASQL